MINPNRNTSKDVLRRLKEASYERMRVELKCNIESKMVEFGMTWDDLGRLCGVGTKLHCGMSRGDKIKWKIVEGSLTLNDLTTLAHLFSCEPYIIFRPREPYTRT